MPGFADSPLVGPGSELQLMIDAGAVPHADVVAEGGPEPTSIAVDDAGELVELAPEVGEGEREDLELVTAAAVLAGRRTCSWPVSGWRGGRRRRRQGGSTPRSIGRSGTG